MNETVERTDAQRLLEQAEIQTQTLRVIMWCILLQIAVSILAAIIWVAA